MGSRYAKIWPTALLLCLAACGTASTSSNTNAAYIEAAAFKELLIVHPSVVKDPVRTSNLTGGHWSFRWLMERLSSGSGLSPAAFTEAWLREFRLTRVPGTNLTLNDRQGVDDLLRRWRKDGTGHIDLRYAPFRLMAIVNRVDKGTHLSDMGEGRFVFALVDPDTLGDGSNAWKAEPMAMTVIFEFHLPGQPTTEVRDQKQRSRNALRWRKLASLPFGETYNAALEAITTAFVSTYGPASLNQLRTNEIALAGKTLFKGQPGPAQLGSLVWELREFKLVGGRLRTAPVQATAADQFNRDPSFAAYLVDHRADVLNGSLDLGRFKGYVATQNFAATTWAFPAIGGQAFPEDIRGAFAKGTCNGCHNAEQASLPTPQFPGGQNLGFYHISPFVSRNEASGDLAGTEAVSDFMKKIDLQRRARFVGNVLRDPTNLTDSTALED